MLSSGLVYQRPAVNQIFICNFKVQFGEAIFLLGNIGKLGGWIPRCAIRLQCFDNEWRKEIPIPINTPIQYKFFIHSYQLPEEEQIIIPFDRWLGNERNENFTLDLTQKDLKSTKTIEVQFQESETKNPESKGPACIDTEQKRIIFQQKFQKRQQQLMKLKNLGQKLQELENANNLRELGQTREAALKQDLNQSRQTTNMTYPYQPLNFNIQNKDIRIQPAKKKGSLEIGKRQDQKKYKQQILKAQQSSRSQKSSKAQQSSKDQQSSKGQQTSRGQQNLMDQSSKRYQAEGKKVTSVQKKNEPTYHYVPHTKHDGLTHFQQPATFHRSENPQHKHQRLFRKEDILGLETRYMKLPKQNWKQTIQTKVEIKIGQEERSEVLIERSNNIQEPKNNKQLKQNKQTKQKQKQKLGTGPKTQVQTQNIGHEAQTKKGGHKFEYIYK